MSDNYPKITPPQQVLRQTPRPCHGHRKALARIAEVFVEAFIVSHTTEPEELILDFDPTDDPVHGNQEKRFFHGYYDEVYCLRGEAENRIKEQQLGLFADRTSCHDFVANQFRVLLSAAAYILVDTLRREGLAGTELANAQVGTIRLKLLKIGGRVVSSVRRIVFHLAGGYPLKDLFVRILDRLCELSVRSTAFG